jgi:hypothetical protein
MGVGNNGGHLKITIKGVVVVLGAAVMKQVYFLFSLMQKRFNLWQVSLKTPSD